MPRSLCPATWDSHVLPLACELPAGHEGSEHYDGEHNHAFNPEDTDGGCCGSVYCHAPAGGGW